MDASDQDIVRSECVGAGKAAAQPGKTALDADTVGVADTLAAMEGVIEGVTWAVELGQLAGCAPAAIIAVLAATKAAMSDAENLGVRS